MTRFPRWPLLLCTLFAVGLNGCGWTLTDLLSTVGDSTEDGATDEVLGFRPEPPALPTTLDETEPNDNFSEAQDLRDLEAVLILADLVSMDAFPDHDVYQLAGGQAGDELRVSFDIDGSSTALVGLLDADQNLLGQLYWYSSYSSARDLSVILRADTPSVYLVVAAPNAQTTVTYSAQYLVYAGNGLPAFRPQILVLDFEAAANVRIGSQPAVDVPAFDATVISARFAGQTEAIIELVIDAVRQDYTGLDVLVYRSTDPDLPAGEHTTLHFGTYSPTLLGRADSIDPYNADRTQRAILYTDTFALFEALNPSTAQIAQVLANVASHEAGHLLGLRHTADAHDLMDITASARQMLSDQWFRPAPLHTTVLPLGLQDAPSLLEWAVGGQWSDPAAKRVRYHSAVGGPISDDDFLIPRHLLGSCCNGHNHE